MATTPRKPAKPRLKTPATRRSRPVKAAKSKPDGAADNDDQPTATDAAIDLTLSEPAATASRAVDGDSPEATAAETPARPPSKARPAPKPRSTNRAKPRPTPKVKPKPAHPPVTADDADKPASRWGKAMIAGGILAVGAAALLSLRSSSEKPGVASDEDTSARQADGTDASASFEAGIADEGTIPS